MLKKRKQTRIPKYNYAAPGYYFITICAYKKQNLFTTVGAPLACARTHVAEQYEFELTKIGEIINKQWYEIENKYPNIELDEFIIMPNHVHGIIVIGDVNWDKIKCGELNCVDVKCKNCVGSDDNVNRAQASSAPTVGVIVFVFFVCVPI